MFIRPLASPAELDWVASRMRATLVEVLGAERGGLMYTLDWLRARAQQHVDQGCVFLAHEGSRLLGHTIVRMETRDLGLFSTTWVEPHARRQGAAAVLLDHGERWLLAQGATTLATNTSGSNTPLVHLFERRGYRITTRTKEMVQLTRAVTRRVETLARWAPALAYRRTNASVVTERSGWFQIRTPGGATGQNEVLFGVPKDVDAVLAAYSDPLKWCVTDARLEALLGARGFAFWGARAMVAPATPIPHGARVERVTPELQGLCAQVYATGWGGGVDEHLARVREPNTRHVLAFLDGQPAGAAAVHEQPGVDYLMGAVVLPSARRRGLYKALLAGRTEGATGTVLTHARDATSAPILERLGFETVFRYRCGVRG
jgi:GNAT superfamily N-acetyltransferase